MAVVVVLLLLQFLLVPLFLSNLRLYSWSLFVSLSLMFSAAAGRRPRVAVPLVLALWLWLLLLLLWWSSSLLRCRLLLPAKRINVELTCSILMLWPQSSRHNSEAAIITPAKGQCLSPVDAQILYLPIAC